MHSVGIFQMFISNFDFKYQFKHCVSLACRLEIYFLNKLNG